VVTLWNLASLTPKGEFEGAEDTIFSCAMDLDGSWIAGGTGQNDCRCLVWSAVTKQVLHELPHNGSVRSVLFEPNGCCLWTGSLDKRVRLFDCRTGACEISITGHRAGVHCIQLVPEHFLLGSSSGRPENVVRVFDVRKVGKQHSGLDYKLADADTLLKLEGHRSAVSSFAMDSVKVVSGSYDSSVRGWALKSRGCHPAGSPLFCFEEASAEAAVQAVAVAGSSLFAGFELRQEPFGLIVSRDFSNINNS